MKRTLILLGALLALTLMISDLQAQQRRGGGGGQGGGGGGGQGRGNQGTSALQQRSGNPGVRQSQGVSQGRFSTGVNAANNSSIDLSRLWEEEKLARDVYNTLGKTSGLQIFQNIARAESQHMQSVARLAGRVNGRSTRADGPGVFSYADYQTLYGTLVASGSRSPLDALMVGAKIEEMDIADLRTILNSTVNSQVQQVLQRLLRGSENHLRAFASQINALGATYQAQFLTQAEFDRIASSSRQGNGQLGNSNGLGQGGAGRGNGQPGNQGLGGRQQAGSGVGNPQRGRQKTGRQGRG